MIVVQDGDEVFFEVVCDILEGTELLVWYGDSYLKYMGIPITMKEKISAEMLYNLGRFSSFFILVACNVKIMYQRYLYNIQEWSYCNHYYYESRRTVESHQKFVYRPLPQTSTTAPT
jgi:hypothetical protein